MPKLAVQRDLGDLMHLHSHGESHKIGLCIHETVSPNYPGMRDINSVADYLGHGKDGYAIHAINDNDGNIAVAKNHGKDVFYHCAGGNTNYNYLGLEQISDVMTKYKTRTTRIRAWLHMDKELNGTAKLIACYARAWGFPIVDTLGNTNRPGVTTHYDVTKHFGVSGGHTDAWPSTRGGYYPLRLVLTLAKRYYALGWHF